LRHHSAHDILRSLAILAPSRDLQHQLVERSSVGHESLVEMLYGEEMLLQACQLFLALVLE
jgi:hypothetical protein